MKKIILKFLVWLDRRLNDKWLKGRFETISGRCYRNAKKGEPICIWLVGVLDAIDPGHCERAYIGDRKLNPNLPI